MMTEVDRRAYPRVRTAKPVKLRSDRTGVRWLAGLSQDVSAGGVLVELMSTCSFQPGDRVQVGLAMTGRQAMIRSSQIVEATVVRSLGHAGRQHLAIRFAEGQRLAQTG